MTVKIYNMIMHILNVFLFNKEYQNALESHSPHRTLLTSAYRVHHGWAVPADLEPKALCRVRDFHSPKINRKIMEEDVLKAVVVKPKGSPHFYSFFQYSYGGCSM